MESVQHSETFECVYLRYDFAPLVRIVLVLAGRIKEIKDSKFHRMTKVTGHHSAGGNHAHEA